jgi:hypothetical protein
VCVVLGWCVFFDSLKKKKKTPPPPTTVFNWWTKGTIFGKHEYVDDTRLMDTTEDSHKHD